MKRGLLLGLFEIAAFAGSTAVTNEDAAAVKLAVFTKSALLMFIDVVDDRDRAAEDSIRLSVIVDINAFMVNF